MLFGKKEILVGLDIGSRAVKVAEISDTKSGRKLKRFGMAEIPPGAITDGAISDPDTVAHVIRQLFKSANVKESNVAVSIGGYSVIVKKINVQTIPEAQLQETIHFEAEQHIPFDISDVNLDVQILGEVENNSGQMNVFLVSAKKEMVKDYGGGPRCLDSRMGGITLEPEPVKVNLDLMIDLFKTGYQQFAPIYKDVFSAENFSEINKAACLEATEFYMPTAVWLKILYELAATYRHWKVNRNKLLDIMTPLYFARVASFVRQSWNMSSQEAEALVEEQAAQFEEQKDYLIRAWDEKAETAAKAEQKPQIECPT